MDVAEAAVFRRRQIEHCDPGTERGLGGENGAVCPVASPLRGLSVGSRIEDQAGAGEFGEFTGGEADGNVAVSR
jgi:hypothetical protein